MAGEKGDQEWVKMWGADVKVVNPGNLMPDDMLKSCITTTQKVSAGGRGEARLIRRQEQRGEAERRHGNAYGLSFRWHSVAGQ